MKYLILTLLVSFIPLAANTQETNMNNESTSLNPAERQMVLISAATARGDMETLRKALSEGLDAGLTVNEIKEVLVQLYAYCGFPRSLNALNTFMTVTRERKAAGKNDLPGKLPGPLPGGNSVSFGETNQTRLTGNPVKGELFEFAPTIDQFLKGHLFGDIFGRDNLDWRIRELATIAALSAMEGVESQLKSHIRIGMHNGLSEKQIGEITSLSESMHNADVFPRGGKAPANFTGEAWVAMLVDNQDYNLSAYNVTFSPGTRNNWHSHTVGQILLCTVGTGYYQERGKAARRLVPGDVVEIPADTEHWHGAAPDSEFVHIGLTPRADENKTTWVGPVTDREYADAVTLK